MLSVCSCCRFILTSLSILKSFKIQLTCPKGAPKTIYLMFLLAFHTRLHLTSNLAGYGQQRFSALKDRRLAMATC